MLCRVPILATLCVAMLLGACGGGGSNAASAPAPGIGTGTFWQPVSSLAIPYSGGVLANGILDDPRDGSKLFVFSGPGSGNAPVPFKVVKITAAGLLDDATGAMMPEGASGAVHARRLVTGDFNGDGVTDFFSANHGFDLRSSSITTAPPSTPSTSSKGDNYHGAARPMSYSSITVTRQWRFSRRLCWPTGQACPHC
jgi:hypothetical protein